MTEMRKQKQYTKEFKVEAVKLVLDQGMKVANVAKDLGGKLSIAYDLGKAVPK